MKQSFICLFFTLHLLTMGTVLPLFATDTIPLSKNQTNPENLRKIATGFTSIYKGNKSDFDKTFTSFFFKQCNGDSIDCRYSLAYVYFINKDYVKTIKYCLRSQSLARTAKKKEIEAEILILAGSSYHRLNYYEKAMYYYQKSLQFADNELPHQRKVRTLLDMGNACFEMNYIDSALFHYQKAYENAKLRNDTVNLISSLINIGNLHKSQKNYDASEYFTKKALDLSLACKSDQQVISYFNLAEISFELKKYSQSREFFQKALINVKNSHFERLIPKTYQYLASMDYETGNDEMAIRNCRLFQENKDKFIENKDYLEALHEIGRILINLIDKPYATEILKRNIGISDSIFKAEVENRKHLQESFRYLVSYKENYKNLEQQNHVNIEKLHNSRILSVSISLILCLIIIAMVFFLRTGKKIRDQKNTISLQLNDITIKNEQTERLNKEISEQAEKIIIQNEHLTKYQDQLEKLIEERTQELSMALAWAQESDNLKTAFLQNISHEIRTPLNAINGFSHLMLDSCPEKKAYVEIINKSISDLLEMVENIMDFAKIHSNQVNIRKNEFKIERLIHDLQEDLKNISSKYSNKSIEFKLKNQINPDIKIDSDIKMIRKIIVQLIENSFKFTENGYIQFSISSDGEFFRFSVSDTGIGIKKDQIPHIFEVFRKINGEHKLFRGTGVGLAIVKKYVELLQGEIKVESEYGKGTTFCVQLPL